MGDATGEIDGHLGVHGPQTPRRICGPDEVVLHERSPFLFVGGEQRRAGPALQDPRELPADVESIGDGGVHPVAPRGEIRWAASPTRKTSSSRRRSAIWAANENALMRSMRGDRPATPVALAIMARTRSSV